MDAARLTPAAVRDALRRRATRARRRRPGTAPGATRVAPLRTESSRGSSAAR